MPGGAVKLTYKSFDLFVDPERGLKHIQVTEPIEAIIDDLILFGWNIDFVRRLAELDGDPRLVEDSYVIAMRRLGVSVLGFHLGNSSDYCIGFDCEASITDERYPADAPVWRI
jgi:hypothetical protein